MKATCLMRVLEPRDRSASALKEDWLGVSWESAGSDHGAGEGQLNFM